MRTINRILHPTDMSDQSANVFQFACALAQDYQASLVLLYVLPDPPICYGETGVFPLELEESTESKREKLMRMQPRAESLMVNHFVTRGDIVMEILHVAEEQECDLIVMGTHGRTGLKRFFDGSIAEQVLRKALCPVLTVKLPAVQKAVAPKKRLFAAVQA